MSRPSINFYQQGHLDSHTSVYPDQPPIFSIWNDEFSLMLSTEDDRATGHMASLDRVIADLTAYRDALRVRVAREDEPAVDGAMPAAA